MTAVSPKVAVYLVTYRRPLLLRRALASVLNQSHSNLLVRVVNDDPHDHEVSEIVAAADDPRVSLFEPVLKRGATQNFNLMTCETDSDYVSLLEDDNWWEPRFLETMLNALEANPDHRLAVGNERIWRENLDGSWTDLNETVWPIFDVRAYRYRLEDICGSAILCNSSMLIRADNLSNFKTPETIPVDVTEHFRERLIGHCLLQVGIPLVNYAETLSTARATRGESWSRYQYLLIGSVFAALPNASSRQRLAARLWSECGNPLSPRSTTLVATGIAIREARALLRRAPPLALIRGAVWFIRKPRRLLAVLTARNRGHSEFDFLTRAPLTRHLVQSMG